MSSATKRILGVGVVGILMFIVAFAVGDIIGTDNATTASSAFLDMLFVGVWVLFSVLSLPASLKRLRHTLNQC